MAKSEQLSVVLQPRIHGYYSHENIVLVAHRELR
jgi:hypothetical protein